MRLHCFTFATWATFHTLLSYGQHPACCLVRFLPIYQKCVKRTSSLLGLSHVASKCNRGLSHQTVVLLYLACSGVRGSSVGSHATVQEGGIPPIFRALCTFMLVLRLPRLVSRPHVGLATSPVFQPIASVLHTRRL